MVKRLYNKKSKEELVNDLKAESFKRITCSFYKYTEIKKAEYLKIDGYDRRIKYIEGRNKNLSEINTKLIEENKKFVDKEDIIKKVQLWLETNSGEINFKIGKELYDIIT